MYISFKTLITIHSDFLSQRVHTLFLLSSTFTQKLQSLNVLVDSRLAQVWGAASRRLGKGRVKKKKFQKLAVLFLEIWRHKVRLFTREQLTTFRYLPPENRVYWCQHYLLCSKIVSLTQNYIPLHISAIFNKKNNFLISNFSWTLVWKMTAATPLANLFCKNVLS